MTSFDALYPTPDRETATARQVAGWYAAHALYLLGRADRIQEQGRATGNDTYLTAITTAAADTNQASLLGALSLGRDPDQTARQLLTAIAAGEDYTERAASIAQWGGHDPDKARKAGYES